MLPDVGAPALPSWRLAPAPQQQTQAPATTDGGGTPGKP